MLGTAVHLLPATITSGYCWRKAAARGDRNVCWCVSQVRADDDLYACSGVINAGARVSWLYWHVCGRVRLIRLLRTFKYDNCISVCVDVCVCECECVSASVCESLNVCVLIFICISYANLVHLVYR